MANKSIVSNSKLDALAQAIATKGGGTLPMTVDEMTAAVGAISGEDLLQHRVSEDAQYGYENENIIQLTPYAFANDLSLVHISLPALQIIQEKGMWYTYNLREDVVFPELTGVMDEGLSESGITGFTAPKIHNINYKAFNYGYFLEFVDLGSENSSYQIYIGSYAFANCSALNRIIIRNNAVATLSSSDSISGSSQLEIFVPDTLVSQYQSASNWTAHASRIKPLSELPTT